MLPSQHPSVRASRRAGWGIDALGTLFEGRFEGVPLSSGAGKFRGVQPMSMLTKSGRLDSLCGPTSVTALHCSSSERLRRVTVSRRAALAKRKPGLGSAGHLSQSHKKSCRRMAMASKREEVVASAAVPRRHLYGHIRHIEALCYFATSYLCLHLLHLSICRICRAMRLTAVRVLPQRKKQ